LPEFSLDPADQNAITSAGYKDWLQAVRSPSLAKTGSAGVFLHEPQRKFSKLFWQEAYYDADQAMGGSFIHAFDTESQQWMAIDCTGHTAPVAQFAMKNWVSMSSRPAKPPIFAGKDIIFIQPDKGIGQQEGDAQVAEIIPTQGGISRISGDLHKFYTVEGDGRYFCIYTLKQGKNVYDEDAYARKTITRGEISIFSDEISSALPTIKFVSTITMDGTTYPILGTKSPLHCRIYLCRENMDGYFFEPIMVFSAVSPITAITTSGLDDAIYIALKNEGIKKYSAKKKSSHFGEIFVEDETFSANSGYVELPEIVSLAVGDNGLTGTALYAVAADDLIYRFAADGTPDYMVEFKAKWH
jgi:hypothetical protein